MMIHCKIPGTAREIIESLMINKAFSIQQIAENIGVSNNTIYRIRKGFNPKPKTHLGLIRFYLYIYNKSLYIQDEVPCS
jgi:transcriptional regulator with XRE-family HTH domain